MTLQEACELAAAIEGNSNFAVIAIGRLTEELSSESKKTLSWGLSIVSLRDRSDRIVAHSEADWIQFAKVQSRPDKPTVATKQPAKLTFIYHHQKQPKYS